MGKGGGGGGPQQTTAYQTNLPEYAKPYVENMLNAAQAQIYNPDMTSFREYKPYSTDPTKYFAGPSGLQQSTYGEAAGMQTPGGFAPAQQLTGLAAMGQMGAGRDFARQATDPNAVARYMSPYMQNVVDTQKLAALRDYQVATPARQAQQTLRGAFGGSRSAIENAEAQRNLMSQLQGIQATGTQQAFQNAQAQQQFGANLGLQGLGAAAQSAGQLGQLAGSQQQADIARLGLQNQLGQQQQQYQQGIINQAIQDYATQQQYPYMQLSTMSNLLRGLPMQNMTTQGYQAQPNLGSQVLGLGATALGAYGASGGFRGFKAGGKVKGYAGPEGSLVSSGATGVAGSIERQLMGKEVPELIQIAKTNPSEQIREMAGRIAAAKQLQERQAQSMGLEGAPAGNLDDIGMAGGGIVAFAGTDGSLVELTDEEKAAIDKDPEIQKINLMNKYFTSHGMGQQSPEAKAIAENIADIKKGLGENYDNRNFYNAVMLGGIGAAKGKSQNFLENVAGGLESGVTGYMKGQERKEDLMNKLRTGEIDLAKLSGAERANLMKYSTDFVTRSEERKRRGLEAKERGTDREYTARLNAFNSAYSSLLKAKQDKLGTRPLTDKDLQDIRKEAKAAADDFITGAKGLTITKIPK